jgi:hypothetical protein
MVKIKKNISKKLKNQEIINEEIRKKAYELYEKSGCVSGRDIDNWLEAEKIVNCE